MWIINRDEARGREKGEKNGERITIEKARKQKVNQRIFRFYHLYRLATGDEPIEPSWGSGHFDMSYTMS